MKLEEMVYPLRQKRLVHRWPQPKWRFKKLERDRTASKVTWAKVQMLMSHFTKIAL